MTNAKQVLQPFFEKYPEDDLKYILWHMVRNSVGCKYAKWHIRLTVMDFYKDLIETLSDLYPLIEKRPKKF